MKNLQTKTLTHLTLVTPYMRKFKLHTSYPTHIRHEENYKQNTHTSYPRLTIHEKSYKLHTLTQVTLDTPDMIKVTNYKHSHKLP